jgi:hypothetical protein
MKKLLLATTLCAAFGAAQAIPVLSYDVYAGLGDATEGAVFNFSGTKLNQAINGTYFASGTNNYSGYKGGSLSVDLVPANLTFTYMGKEAGHRSSFTYDFGGVNENSFYTATTIRGFDFSVSVGVEGNLELKFTDITASNTNAFSGYAESNPNNDRFGFLDVRDIDFGDGVGEYDYLILFNDVYADSDFNDMVIAVSAVQAIPEPETYALMLAGLGVVGFMARRRRQV